jgi:hypothetical protein
MFDHVSGFGLLELLKDVENPRGIEIGCLAGDTTYFLLKSKPDMTLYSIDPYQNYIDWHGHGIGFQEYHVEHVKQKMSVFGSRFTLVRKTSDDACDQFEDNGYDFIFIDGLHTYEQVLKDCKNYYSKIKPGGVFAGHDFTVIDAVNKAVNEFATSVQKNVLQTKNDVWYWIK